MPDDHAASIRTDGSVAVGGSAAGDIETTRDRDWFAVELVAGRTYAFDLEGSPTDAGMLRDPYLRGIYDSNGQLLSGTTNDDGGIGRNSRVYFEAPTDGTYYVAAGARGYYSEFNTGTYTLSVAAIEDDLAAATPTSGVVTVGGSATSEIEEFDDRDWFAVELSAGTLYRIDLGGSLTGDGTLRDPYLYGIYDLNGQLLSGTTNDDGGYGWNSRVGFEAPTDGTYYVAAGSRNHYSEFHTGTYTLSVAAIEDDLAAAESTSGVVAVGGSATGEIGEPYDQDWFAVVLDAGIRYRIDLEGYRTRDGTLWNPALYGIHDPNGQLLSGTTDINGCAAACNARVYFEAPTDGTYYVAAGADSSRTGTYTLSVAVNPIEDDFAAATSTSGVVTVGGSATGEIDWVSDQDWFKVVLTDGIRYRIDLEGRATGDGTLWDPYLRGIYDSNGQLLSGTTHDGGGTRLNARAYFEAPTDGTYYVAADAGGSHTGTYTLSVVEDAI